MRMRISVIVPVYKVEKYLDRCVQSIMRQTYKNLEIILVDDGSPDRCPRMCDEYAAVDSRIKVIHKENGGLSDARNRGLHEATGEYIAFVDSDDYIHPEMMERLLTNLRQNSADISIVGFKEIHEEAQQEPVEQGKAELFSAEEAIRRLLSDNSMGNYACNKLYKCELFEQIEFPVGRKMEDMAIMYKLFWKCENVVFDETPLYYYYQRADSILHRLDKSFYTDFYDATYARFVFLREKYPGMIENDENAIVGLIWAYSNISPDEDYCKKLRGFFKEVEMNASIGLTNRTKLKKLLCQISPNLYGEFYRILRKRTL